MQFSFAELGAELSGQPLNVNEFAAVHNVLKWFAQQNGGRELCFTRPQLLLPRVAQMRLMACGWRTSLVDWCALQLVFMLIRLGWRDELIMQRFAVSLVSLELNRSILVLLSSRLCIRAFKSNFAAQLEFARSAW